MDQAQTYDYWFLLDVLVYTQQRPLGIELAPPYDALTSEVYEEVA